MILSGDIGGTNTRLCLVPRGGSPQEPLLERRYRSGEHPSFMDILDRFLDETKAMPVAAAIGVAGPVFNGVAQPTHIPWALDESELRRRLGTDAVRVKNDLETTGYGIRWLREDQFLTLNKGEPYAAGNGALIAAGTGLGKAILVRNGEGFDPLPSEGGHAEFPPRDALQDELVRALRARHGGVVAEHVVSGRGLVSIYQFFISRPGAPAEPAEIRARMATTDAAQVISEAGLAGEDENCRAALQLFVRCYGAEAANLGATALATGGVFVGGGIAPKIREALTSGAFMEAFCQNPSLGPLLRRMPVHVILEEDTSLIGAAGLALSLAEA